MEAWSAKPQLRVLLDHLAIDQGYHGNPGRSRIRCARCCSWSCAGTIASGDDYDDIVDWGEAHLSFLRRFSEFYHGIPCADWLRTVMNRIDRTCSQPAFRHGSPNAGPTGRPRATTAKRRRRSHDEKQAANRSGSIRFMTVRSQSRRGIPW